MDSPATIPQQAVESTVPDLQTRKRKIHCKQELIVMSLQSFYAGRKDLPEVMELLQGTSIISLRLIDWFVTNYAKRHNIGYVIGGQEFMVYMSYKSQLKAYSKKLFDPFKREVSRRNPLPVITPKPKLASIVSSVPLIPKLRMEAKVPIPVVKVPMPVVSSVPLIPKLRMVSPLASPIVQPLASPIVQPMVSPLVPKLPIVKKEKVNNIPDLKDILKDIDSLRSRLNKYITANESK